MTNDEQHALDVIERGLRRDDPILADRLAGAATLDQRRRRCLLARRTMIASAVFTLLALTVADGLISLGSVFAGDGLIILVIALVVALRNRTGPDVGHSHRRFSTWGWGP